MCHTRARTLHSEFGNLAIMWSSTGQNEDLGLYFSCNGRSLQVSMKTDMFLFFWHNLIVVCGTEVGQAHSFLFPGRWEKSSSQCPAEAGELLGLWIMLGSENWVSSGHRLKAKRKESADGQEGRHERNMAKGAAQLLARGSRWKDK